MLCITSEYEDTYFNLAAEEYFFRERDDDIFMLWSSEPAVITGKHQNTLAEINFKFIKDNNIRVARRLSGGGAVYHDPGNINFTFIRNGEPGKLINFQRFTEPVINVLHSLSVSAEFGGKNDILINGKKISGNAGHIYRNRVLHHGTLLFDSNLDNLYESLKAVPGRYTDKAVKSIRSKVTNISRFIDSSIDITEFRGLLMKYILDNNDNAKIHLLSDKEKAGIQLLAEKKYSTWEWIYGYSPKYSLEGIFNTGEQEILFRLFVENGIIMESGFSSVDFNNTKLAQLSGFFRGMAHRETDLKGKADRISDLLLINEAGACDFVDSLF